MTGWFIMCAPDNKLMFANMTVHICVCGIYSQSLLKTLVAIKKKYSFYIGED